MQRMEAVGQLTSGVAHDFNNLLTVVLGNIPFLERGLAAAGIDGRMQRRLDYMRLAAERGAKLTDQLLSFSRRQRLEPRPIDLNESVAAMHDLLHSTMGGTVRIETRLDPGLWPAMVDPTQLELVVLNLAINARDAMEVGGTLVVATANVRLGPPATQEEPAAGEYVCLSVSDSGTGMAPDVIAKALEPFFTTKEAGKGSGLGLSQVLGFVKQSGGGLRIESTLGEGTTVCVYLPPAAAAPSRDEAPARARAAQGVAGAALVLLVDDDDDVRATTAEMLQDIGCRVIQAESGAAALEALQREAAIDLLMVDFAMPGMNGAELRRRAQSARPDMPVLMITGFADRAALPALGEDYILGKPFSQDELARRIARLLADRRSGKVASLQS